MNFYNKHYIRLDGNKVVKGFSDAFELPLETDILFNSEGGRHFEIDGEINPPLYDERGCHLYRYEDGLRLATPEEIATEWEEIKPEPPVDKVAELTAMVEAQAEEIQNLQKQLDTATIQNADVRRAAFFSAVTFTDEQAIQVPNLYPEWNPNGMDCKTGDRLRYGTALYKVISDHKSQANWTPDTAPSLFTRISAPDEGTKDHPITWVSGMESEKDKYYIDSEGLLYIGLEDSGIGLYGEMKDLPRYFERVDT